MEYTAEQFKPIEQFRIVETPAKVFMVQKRVEIVKGFWMWKKFDSEWHAVDINGQASHSFGYYVAPPRAKFITKRQAMQAIKRFNKGYQYYTKDGHSMPESFVLPLIETWKKIS